MMGTWLIIMDTACMSCNVQVAVEATGSHLSRLLRDVQVSSTRLQT